MITGISKRLIPVIYSAEILMSTLVIVMNVDLDVHFTDL